MSDDSRAASGAAAGTLAPGRPDFAEQQRLRAELLKLERERNDLIRQLQQSNAGLQAAQAETTRLLAAAERGHEILLSVLEDETVARPSCR